MSEITDLVQQIAEARTRIIMRASVAFQGLRDQINMLSAKGDELAAIKPQLVTLTAELDQSEADLTAVIATLPVVEPIVEPPVEEPIV